MNKSLLPIMITMASLQMNGIRNWVISQYINLGLSTYKSCTASLIFIRLQTNRPTIQFFTEIQTPAAIKYTNDKTKAKTTNSGISFAIYSVLLLYNLSTMEGPGPKDLEDSFSEFTLAEVQSPFSLQTPSQLQFCCLNCL